MDTVPLMVLSIILNIASASIALYIVYKIYRIYRLLKDKYLLLIVLGFLVLAIGSLVSMLSSTYVLVEERDSQGLYLEHMSNYTDHMPMHDHEKHPMTPMYPYGPMHHPWIHGEKSPSWKIISFSSPLYPLAYLLILLGIVGEFIEEKSLGAYYIFLSTGSILVLGSDILSLIILTVILVLSIEKRTFTIGCIGYILFLASHLLRAIAVIMGSPGVFLFGEILRPMGLVAIAVGVSVHGRE